MFSRKNKKKAFTLIEMLIVIVIIGILAAALIPRLASARGRANDVARKADLAQTAAALVSSQIDKGTFPSTIWSLANISWDLISAGMSSIPDDPTSDRKFYGIWNSQIIDWQFGYAPITKWWIAGNGFALMAGTETEWWSNRVADNGHWRIPDDYPSFESITPCKTFISHPGTGTPTNVGWVCNYYKWSDQLRYIYIY